MITFTQYLKIWAASIRYSMVRSMMFRFDFLLWMGVGLIWTVVNVLLIEVIFGHIESLAGWSKYEMLLLIGTNTIISRIFNTFFLTNLLELGRKIRMGEFDFTIVQPGSPLFMVTTRKIDLDGLPNIAVGLGIVMYSAMKLGIHPSVADLAIYTIMVFCGVVFHFSGLLLIASTSFWIISTEGAENGYFSLFQFGRIPQSAFKGFFNFLLVYLFPVVIITNIPARVLIDGITWMHLAWLLTAVSVWFVIAFTVFRLGSIRYTSASS